MANHVRKSFDTSSLNLPNVDVAQMRENAAEPVITFDRCTIIYEAQPNKPALNDISVQVFAGEFVFLVGHSGSGKSTFIRLLIRELKPTRGHVYIANEDLGSMRS